MHSPEEVSHARIRRSDPDGIDGAGRDINCGVQSKHLETGKADWKPAPTPATIEELLDIYERQSADIVRRFQALPAERWDGMLDFFGRQRPAPPMAWSFLFDIVHHRGQITTYLRPMGSTVPQIYGPSADEP